MLEAPARSEECDANAGRRSRRVTIEATGVSFPCAPDDTILAAALRAGIGIAYECSSGGCGSCKFDLVDGELEILRDDVAGLKPRDFERGKRLACASRPLSDCRIRVREAPDHTPAIRPARRVGILVDRFALTHDLWEFRFKIEGDGRFIPGQYALLEFPQLGCVRAYSMANTPSADGEWHFQIKRTPGGRATTLLFDGLELGDALSIDGPFSAAHLRPTPRDIVCIAGGSGLAPMLSVARGALTDPAHDGRNIHLFYGGRTERDIVGLRHLGLPVGDGRIQYYPVLSDPAPGDNWEGRAGLVHEHVAAQLDQPFDTYEFYIAGPPAMVEAVRRMLILEKATPVDQVHYDRFF